MKFAKEDIIPYFQPIVAVADGSILGHEVLGRLQTSNGIESLGDFFTNPNISNDEKLSVDRIVREKAMAIYKKQNRDDLLFLNIHPSWILAAGDKEFYTIELLKKYGIAGNRIVIEILEQEYNVVSKSLNEMIQLYYQAGCRLAVDDFNFSNFDRLIQLKPDFVKIDIRLVRLSSQQVEYHKILNLIAQYSLELGISVLFEGVEKQIELENALETGASYIQGFLCAYPSDSFAQIGLFQNMLKSTIGSVVNRISNRHRNILQIEKEMNNIVAHALKRNIMYIHENTADLDNFLTGLSQELPPFFFKSYICDKEGNQVSSNVTREENGEFIIHSEFRGKNWSWRPYFINNVVRMEQMSMGVISGKYIDIEKKRETITFSFPLNEEFYLFLDFYYND